MTYFNVTKCDCDSSDFHGYPSEVGQSQPVSIYYHDSDSTFKKRDVVIQVVSSTIQNQICYQILFVDDLYCTIYLPIYVDAFKTKYIQRETTRPFSKVKLWYSDSDSNFTFNNIMILKNNKYHSHAVITRKEKYLKKYDSETQFALSYWCTKLEDKDFENTKNNYLMFKSCGFFSPFHINSIQVIKKAVGKKNMENAHVSFANSITKENCYVKSGCLIPNYQGSWIIGFSIKEIPCGCKSTSLGFTHPGTYRILFQNEPQIVYVNRLSNSQGSQYRFSFERFLPSSLKSEDWIVQLPFSKYALCDCKTALIDDKLQIANVITPKKLNFSGEVCPLKANVNSNDYFIRLDVSAVFEAGQISLSKFPVELLKEFAEQSQLLSFSFTLCFVSQQRKTSHSISISISAEVEVEDDIMELQDWVASTVNFKVLLKDIDFEPLAEVSKSNWEVYLPISALLNRSPSLPVQYVRRADPNVKFSLVKLWLPETDVTVTKKDCLPVIGNDIVVFLSGKYYSLARVGSVGEHSHVVPDLAPGMCFALSHCQTELRVDDFAVSPDYSCMKWNYPYLDPTTIVNTDIFSKLFISSMKGIECRV